MRVSLIFAPFGHVKHLEKTETENEEFGAFPPLNLSYVASITRQAGHKVKLIDAHALKLSKKQVLAKISKFRPDILGFMLTSYMFQRTFDWIRYFKRKTGLPVAVGGINLRLFPEETMSHPEIDFAILGSARAAFPSLLHALENVEPVDKIKGIAFRRKGNVVFNPPDDLTEDLDLLPFPARDLLPNHKYYSYISQRKNFSVVNTSFGCPYNCVFCDERASPYRPRDPKKVVDEVEVCVKKYKVREIDFFDRNFTTSKKRVINICDELIKRKVKIEWSCRSRVDNVDSEMLSKMKRAGCKMILYGIESGDPKILKNMKKQISLDRVRQTVKLTQKHGIRVFGFFMIGAPGETKETAMRTINFAKSLDLDFVQFTRTSAKPLTELHKMITEKTGRDFWRDFVRGKTIEQKLPMPGTDLSQKEIHKLIRSAYLSFYLRPKIIIRAFFNLKSFDELWRYTRSTLKLVVR